MTREEQIAELLSTGMYTEAEATAVVDSDEVVTSGTLTRGAPKTTPTSNPNDGWHYISPEYRTMPHPTIPGKVVNQQGKPITDPWGIPALDPNGNPIFTWTTVNGIQPDSPKTDSTAGPTTGDAVFTRDDVFNNAIQAGGKVTDLGGPLQVAFPGGQSFVWTPNYTRQGILYSVKPLNTSPTEDTQVLVGPNGHKYLYARNPETGEYDRPLGIKELAETSNKQDPLSELLSKASTMGAPLGSPAAFNKEYGTLAQMKDAALAAYGQGYDVTFGDTNRPFAIRNPRTGEFISFAPEEFKRPGADPRENVTDTRNLFSFKPTMYSDNTVDPMAGIPSLPMRNLDPNNPVVQGAVNRKLINAYPGTNDIYPLAYGQDLREKLNALYTQQEQTPISGGPASTNPYSGSAPLSNFDPGDTNFANMLNQGKVNYDYQTGQVKFMADGGSMMLNDPTAMINLNTGQTEAIAGEAGPEQLTVNPMQGGIQGQPGGITPPNMGKKPPPPMVQLDYPGAPSGWVWSDTFSEYQKIEHDPKLGDWKATGKFRQGTPPGAPNIPGSSPREMQLVSAGIPPLVATEMARLEQAKSKPTIKA